MIVLLWSAAINMAMSEIKPKGYIEIDKMKGQYKEVDLLIEKSMPKISIYEMLEIKKMLESQK